MQNIGEEFFEHNTVFCQSNEQMLADRFSGIPTDASPFDRGIVSADLLYALHSLAESGQNYIHTTSASINK